MYFLTKLSKTAMEQFFYIACSNFNRQAIMFMYFFFACFRNSKNNHFTFSFPFFLACLRAKRDDYDSISSIMKFYPI